MSHEDALKLLIPAELAGVFADDLAVEGAVLDDMQERVEALLAEIFADTCDELLSTWEAFFGLVPLPEATLQARRGVVVGKLRAHGNIFKPYFVALAASMGYTIYIQDYTESMAGWHCAGDEVLEEPWVYFTAGIGMAGDYLAFEDVRLPWIWEVVVVEVPAVLPNPGLETVFNDLKSAELQLNFTYL